MQVRAGGAVLSAGVHRMDAVVKPTGTYSRRPADNTAPRLGPVTKPPAKETSDGKGPEQRGLSPFLAGYR